MAQCAAKTKDGTPCQIPTREGRKYCHVHRRQTIWRWVSWSFLGTCALGILSVVADVTGVLGYLGISASPTSTPTVSPTERPNNSVVVGGDVISSTIIQSGGDANIGQPPTPTTTPTSTPIPAIFPQPEITQIAEGVDLPGYSKQASIVRDSRGGLTAFIRYNTGDLAYIQSPDNGKTWSDPEIFDHIPTPGAPQISAAIDSADRVHVVWGRAPEAGNAEYGLLDNGTWVMTETVGTGVFARDIAVDSANHPHIVWSNVDLFHTTYNGQKWIGPERVVRGAWHPDIQVNPSDDLFLFMNDGNFYPTPGVSVHAMDNTAGKWNAPVQVSASPFWSGGAAAAISKDGDIYLVWIGASTEAGGQDEVFFSRYIDGEWQTPFQVGAVNTAAGSTGQESPAIAFDANNVLYVFWRGLNDKNRPVIFARAYGTEDSSISRVTSGWSPTIELNEPNASDVGWPSVADVRPKSRTEGVDVIWSATIGTSKVVEYSHVTYP